jgi:vanadium-dependent haloperoxidase-like protein
MNSRKTLFAVLMIAAATAARADEVTDWNAAAIAAMPTASPPVMLRVLAAMHGAMHDAVNSVEPRYQPYRFSVPANAGASKEAAAAAAAHGVLVAMVPAQKAAFDAALAGSFGKIAEGRAKQDGIEVGRSVAKAMSAWRAEDGFDAKASDKPGTGPGQWQRTPPGMAPGVLPQLGAVTPFLLKSARQFSAPGRPPLAGPQFASDVKEIRAVGARTSAARTAEQTAVAIFWSGNEVPVWNAAALAASRARGLGLHENARLFALLHMAGADATIAAFDIKYTRNDWRPVTAIRAGAAGLALDPKWEPLLVTPPHPEYPSGHCIVSGASAQVLRDFFGSDEVKLDFVYPHGLATVRSFTSFTQMAKEVEDARVWGGIHFRSTDEHSTEMGRKIGGHAVASALRPL